MNATKGILEVSKENSQQDYPEVVVAGMPSCGKTVFLTVLGKKHTNQIIGRESTPLGFRMQTCDKETWDVIEAAYQRLRKRSWPEVTKTGQIMPLRWDVFTGQRRIFQMSSMDIAGETFRKAFGIEASGGAQTSAARQTGNDELIPEAMTLNGEAAAAQRLREAVKAAKVFCFMVNIELPNTSAGRDLTEPEEACLARFRAAVGNMFFVLKDDAELRAKTLILLTQAHRHQGEIDRAGGPASYLGQVCGQDGCELSNLALMYNIPVLAVSAIDETGADGKPFHISCPADIPSSGLFGFLLVVAGLAAERDGLASVKDTFLAYQCERAAYLQLPGQTVKSRLAQARRRHDAAKAFIAACKAYLDDPANLKDDDGSTSLASGSLGNIQRATRLAPEVQLAADTVYLVRDEVWDQALHQAVFDSGPDSEERVPRIVREALETAFPDKKGNATNEEFVYGFDKEDLRYGSEAQSYEEWVHLNLEEYRELRDEAVDILESLNKELNACIKDFHPIKNSAYAWNHLRRARQLHEDLEKKLSAFRSDWLDQGRIPFSELDRLQGDLKTATEKINEYKSAVERYEEDERRRQAAAEAERRRQEKERKEAERKRKEAERQAEARKEKKRQEEWARWEEWKKADKRKKRWRLILAIFISLCLLGIILCSCVGPLSSRVENKTVESTQDTKGVTNQVVPAAAKPVTPEAGEVREFELVNGVKMKFCWCPATTSGQWKKISGGKDSFQMGSADGYSNEEPVHQVTLTKGFWLGQFEVTQAQWKAVMAGDNPSKFKGDDDRPVDSVSWKDCMNFIAKCNAAAKGVRFALPTEAQWEYACRAGTTTPFSFGTALNGNQANCDGNYPCGTTEKGPYRRETVPVGSYAPNAWNLYDMHGNVWEWCADCYDGEFYKRDEAKRDPCCASGSYRVIRGGSWDNYAINCRSADRSGHDPSYSYSGLGFRLCCSAGPHAE